MGLIPALAISIGALGAIATYLFLGPLGGLGLSLWAAFIAWATFFHCGGKEAGLQKTITHNIFGAILAWIALLLITQIPLANSIGLPLWAAICVGVTIVVLVMAASNIALSDIPASVYGYASTVAYALTNPDKHLATVTSASLDNPLINIVISMAIGAIFAYISEKVAGALAKS